MESYIQNLFADRLGGNQFGKDDKIYKFEKIKRAKREAMKKNPGKKLIDLGVGEPDEITYDVIINTLRNEADKPENRGYSDNGIFEFKEAASKYLDRVFGVRDIDPETEINHSIGSKPALAMIPAAFSAASTSIFLKGRPPTIQKRSSVDGIDPSTINT